MVTLLLHRQEASAARWSKNDHETGRADVRQVKNNLPEVKNNFPQVKTTCRKTKNAPHPWCDVKPFFLYNIHFTIFIRTVHKSLTDMLYCLIIGKVTHDLKRKRNRCSHTAACDDIAVHYNLILAGRRTG